MDLETALAWTAEQHHAVLITNRKDGRSQSSDVVYGVRDGQILVSVTSDRAKTRNLVRDPRALVHITSPGTFSYLSFDGTVELSPVAAEPGDATCQELADILRLVQGKEHSDWDEFHQAMVDDHRLVVRFAPSAVTGQING